MYGVSFICKETRSSVQLFHKCSTLLQVDYIQITQQDQPIYIPCKFSNPTAPIKTIHVVPPTPPILSYLTKYYLDNSIQQASDTILIPNQYISQHSSSIWSYISFRALSGPASNKPLIFYHFQSNKQPRIHQSSDLL